MESQITRAAALELLRKYKGGTPMMITSGRVPGLVLPPGGSQPPDWRGASGYAVQLGFAAGCSREVIEQGAEMLGWSLDDVLQKTLDAMRDCEARVASEMEKI